ncbi:hypothetical protein [Desulfosporosinus nitroreducens]|uniref:ParB/Sulfiredoxin domain-containing protein n=1 Tax=Desulfosporosinus nitroreducens TaxID=2018668 RepID=A0ABT8QJ18_9FIRM|nr:hypothetical protein [Desulfosporosinus nitroreducens]MDO0821303.1 hypothetical protein [Desulfosporosinus nitroreducens]
MKLMSAIQEQFGCYQNLDIDRSIDNKLNILGINSERKALLKSIRCRIIEIPKDYDQGEYALEIIDLDDLNGYCRIVISNIENWLEGLDDLYKFVNFDRYKGKQQFEQFLNQIENSMDTFGLPEVIELDGFYYIAGNGKHRLTIAKCVGIDKVPVLVKHIRSNL